MTVIDRVLVTVKLPEVPVIVSVAGPEAAVLDAFNVSTLVPEVGLVPHVAVTPLGRPVTDRFALPVKPYSGVSVIVDVVELPWFRLRLFGDAESVNVGAWTASETLRV